LRHDLGDRRIRAFPRGKTTHHDVAVGDHADDTVLIADRHESDIAGCHHLRHLADGLTGAGQDDAAAHDFSNLHGDISFRLSLNGS
jgi:hypothetical protein